jgi:hypothetical protein
LKQIIVNIIVIHKKIISIKANNGDFNPKKSIDHKEFKINCDPKTDNAIFDLLLLIPLSQIIYNEIPISKYKIVHTGPNNQPGGLKKGLFRVKYQVETEETVKNDPIMPANWHITIENTNLK